MSDDMPEVARLLGRQLGLGLIQNEQKNAGVTLRYATVDAVHSDGGVYTADLTVAGGELHAVPMTTDCVNLQPGDRCIVETANHLSIITGVLARPGAWVPVTQTVDWSIPYSNDKARLSRCGNMVSIGGLLKFHGSGQVNHVVVNETIPAGFRPAAGTYGTIAFTGNVNPTINVEPSGKCTMLGDMGSQQWCSLSGSWITDNPMP